MGGGGGASVELLGETSVGAKVSIQCISAEALLVGTRLLEGVCRIVEWLGTSWGLLGSIGCRLGSRGDLTLIHD